MPKLNILFEIIVTRMCHAIKSNIFKLYFKSILLILVFDTVLFFAKGLKFIKHKYIL